MQSIFLARRTPRIGVKGPLPQLMSTLELDGYRWQWKNPLLFSIIWIGLDDAKVEILLISWHFLVNFWLCPPPAHSLTLSCFGILNVFRWYIPGPSFIYVWFVVLEFWNFKCFHTNKKYNFRVLLGGFLDVTSWNVVWSNLFEILTSDTMRCNAPGIWRFSFYS